jgi:hypothetical protein
MVNQQKLSESVMPSLQQNPVVIPPGPPGSTISPAESARYTVDMLESLRKIALRQGQGVLAHLLELAQAEARMLVRAPETPG